MTLRATWIARLLLLSVLLLAACDPSNGDEVDPEQATATAQRTVTPVAPTATPRPTPDIEATIQAGIQATIASQPTSTPAPTLVPTRFLKQMVNLSLLYHIYTSWSRNRRYRKFAGIIARGWPSPLALLPLGEG